MVFLVCEGTFLRPLFNLTILCIHIPNNQHIFAVKLNSKLMNIRKIFKKQVQQYLIDNEENFSKQQLYSAAIEHFGLDRKTISAYYLELQNKGLLEQFNSIAPANYSSNEIKKILRQDGDGLNVSLSLDYEIKTLEQLLEVCEVDTTKWEVVSWQCGKHDLGIKNSQKQIEKTQLFSVKAKFKQITADNSLVVQKDIILKELFENAPEFNYNYEELDTAPVGETYLLELALFDIHFGKLAHKEESGEDYDLKIASKRYREAIQSLLSRVNINALERIFLPIGNDMLTIDNIAGLTTLGTPQDTDSRFYKIVRTVKSLLIETIDLLNAIAPVDVVVCVGNHDQQSSFMIGEMLDAYYHNNTQVSIDNSASLRKYYRYGTTSFMLTHGNKEKHSNLGMIFAAENPKLWAATTQRFIQLGHFHHNKKINYLSNEEFQGFQIQILPSLSGGDAWHTAKGYNSLKQAKAFLYGKTDGLLAEYTFSV